jgi:Kef-type K+ transport system membrane component KefB
VTARRATIPGMTEFPAALVLIPAMAVAAPLLASGLGRFVRIPIVVFEIVLGIVLGPALLGWVVPDDFTSALAQFGLALLFFLAGSEIDFTRLRGRPLNRSMIGWLLALAVAVGVGTLLAHGFAAGVFVGVALTSTALGTIMPVLRDAGELRTTFGTAVIAIGAVGEFGPLIAISLFLSGRRPGVATVVLIAFAVVTGVVIAVSARGSHRRLHRMINATLRTSGQFAVRFVIFVIAVLVALSIVQNSTCCWAPSPPERSCGWCSATRRRPTGRSSSRRSRPSGSASSCPSSSSAPA